MAALSSSRALSATHTQRVVALGPRLVVQGHFVRFHGVTRQPSEAVALPPGEVEEERFEMLISNILKFTLRL